MRAGSWEFCPYGERQKHKELTFTNWILFLRPVTKQPLDYQLKRINAFPILMRQGNFRILLRARLSSHDKTSLQHCPWYASTLLSDGDTGLLNRKEISSSRTLISGSIKVCCSSGNSRKLMFHCQIKYFNLYPLMKLWAALIWIPG